jgi:hypothetical protein
MSNLYATDGFCHNANRGTYGHECGKPATWLGTKASGFKSGFCSACKADGDEARECVAWEARDLDALERIEEEAFQTMMDGTEEDACTLFGREGQNYLAWCRAADACYAYREANGLLAA